MYDSIKISSSVEISFLFPFSFQIFSKILLRKSGVRLDPIVSVGYCLSTDFFSANSSYEGFSSIDFSPLTVIELSRRPRTIVVFRIKISGFKSLPRLFARFVRYRRFSPSGVANHFSSFNGWFPKLECKCFSHAISLEIVAQKWKLSERSS